MSIEFNNGISIEDDNPTVRRYHESHLPVWVEEAALDNPINVKTVLGETTIIAAKKMGGSALIDVVPDRVNPIDFSISRYGAHLREVRDQQRLARVAAMDKPNESAPQSEADKMAQEIAIAKKALETSVHCESYKKLIDWIHSDPWLIKAYYDKEDDAIKDVGPADFDKASVAIKSTAVLPSGEYVTLIDRVHGTANQVKVRASYSHFALVVGCPFDGSDPQICRQTAKPPELDVFRGSGTFLTGAEFQSDLPSPLITAKFASNEKAITSVGFGDEEPLTDLLSARQIRLLSGVVF